ncbi:MAG: hypothetical protein KFH98_16200, partial [Gemmatimonadetes bacterium]|nr:hypothetical protein [Gemmatimonadota bacterium]
MKRIQAERSVLGAFGATVLTIYLLVWWTRQLEIGWLAAALLAFVAAIVLAGAARRRGGVPGALLVSLGLLLPGAGFAAVAAWQVDRIEENWTGIVERRQARLGAELNARMLEVVERGQAAASQAAAIAGSRRESTDMFRPLATLLAQHQVDAIALYTASGGLVAWAGEHRGELPNALWERERTAYFEERPLFSYLYFPVRVPGRDEYAIAAGLVETGIISGEGEGGIGAVVEARTRTRASFRSGGGTDEVWSLAINGDTIVHARLEPLTQRSWREMQERLARRVVLLLSLSSYVALCIGWLVTISASRPAWAAILPVAALLPIMVAAPLRETLGAERLFSPVLFAVPPGDMSLGRLLAVLVPLGALVFGARRRVRPGSRPALRIGAGALAVALSYPLILYGLFTGTTPALLDGPPAYWYGFQFAAVLMLSIATLLALPRRSGAVEETAWLAGSRRRWMLGGSIVVAGTLAALAAGAGDQTNPLPLSASVLWVMPFVLGAAALAPESGRAGAL